MRLSLARDMAFLDEHDSVRFLAETLPLECANCCC
jgi:hypothetical protein